MTRHPHGWPGGQPGTKGNGPGKPLVKGRDGDRWPDDEGHFQQCAMVAGGSLASTFAGVGPVMEKQLRQLRQSPEELQDLENAKRVGQFFLEIERRVSVYLVHPEVF